LQADIVYEMKEEKLVPDVWEIPLVDPIGIERVGYPTQKPEALLERVIKSSSDPGDLILDCFVGSGTAATIAEKFDHRWVACDLKVRGLSSNDQNTTGAFSQKWS
jgi:DNA modification methylase